MFAVVHTIGRMPLSWRYGIARFGSDRIYNWGPNIGKNVRSNMRHVLGPDASDEEIDRVSRQCAQNTGRYYADVDIDLGNPLRDLEGFVIHMGELLSGQDTDHLKLHDALAKRGHGPFIFYDVRRL